MVRGHALRHAGVLLARCQKDRHIFPNGLSHRVAFIPHCPFWEHHNVLHTELPVLSCWQALSQEPGHNCNTPGSRDPDATGAQSKLSPSHFRRMQWGFRPLQEGEVL